MCRYLSICHEEGQKGRGRATDQRLLSDSFATTDLSSSLEFAFGRTVVWVVAGSPEAETHFYDCPALTTTPAANRPNRRLLVAFLPASVLLYAVLIVVVAAIATTLLGVPTSYGQGIEAQLGAQIARDFLADQDAEATALSTGDESVLGGRLTDSALVDVLQEIHSQPTAVARPRVTFQPSSLTVLRAQDPADPSLIYQVREDGTKAVVTSNGPNAAPSEQTVGFHGDFWLRRQSAGNYTIADQRIQILPNSPLPALAVVFAALVFVGVAGMLVIRQRARRPALQPMPKPQASAMPAPAAPADGELLLARSSPAEMIVTTFGGLHIRHQGRSDLAQAVLSRTVTGFVWLRLLVDAIRDPRSQLNRDEVSRQATPRLSRAVQLKRLRNVIAKGLPEMPSVLRDRIVVTPEAMSFRLDGCQVDAVDLLNLSAAAAKAGELSTEEMDHIRSVLAACQGTFLPEFETLEDVATDNHPTCTELIRELRESLTNKRVDLALLLAESYQRTGQPGQAIAVLEPARKDRPERKDLADRLVAAYRSAGREAEAKALEARFA